MSMRTKKKNKRQDRKRESNGSPEIPDRGFTSDIPGLPLGRLVSYNKTILSCEKNNQFTRYSRVIFGLTLIIYALTVILTLR